MIKERKLMLEFERDFLQTEKTDYFKSLRLFEEMWNECVFLKILPLKDPLEGIEVDLRIARIINHV